jgi:hypothetical protein
MRGELSWRNYLNPNWTTNLDPIQTHHSLSSSPAFKDELLKISVVIQPNLALVFS